jgi:hypothetical protein
VQHEREELRQAPAIEAARPAIAPGPSAVARVLWLQRNAGNAATGRMLQREGWRDLDVIGNTLEGLAKLNFSVPLCKDLIDHYCHRHGEEMGLTSASSAPWARRSPATWAATRRA